MSNKRDKFVKLAEARTNVILKYLKLLANCANKYAYEYTDEDIKKIFIEIDKAVKTARERFKDDNLKDEKVFKL
jgi:hypothetical protein